MLVHRRQHGHARRGDAQRGIAQEMLDLLGVLHAADLTTKN
jgi:hypothetical protein